MIDITERSSGGRLSDVTPTTIGAGLLGVLVSYAGPLLIYLQASQAMGVSPENFSSWVFAISMSAGVLGIGFSYWLRVPVVMAWSAPGTVLLIATGTTLSFNEIVGAYVLVALTLILLGWSGLIDRLLRILPPAVTSGMMAGILFSFGLNAMRGLGAEPELFAFLVAAFCVLGTWVPRYTVLILLSIAILIAWSIFDVPFGEVGLTLVRPNVTAPHFSIAAILSLALPLLLTTLSGQFLPGMAILKGYGYQVEARSILVGAGIASLVSAIFGGVTTALASITAAFCAGPDSDPDPGRRYIAGIACGVFFCLAGIFAGTIVDLLSLLPTAMIGILAGLALLGAIQKNVADTVSGPDAQIGLLTFLVTTSGVELFQIGAGFWGVVVGIGAWLLQKAARRPGRP